MIEVRELTKRYGSTLAVDALSFDLRPGTVTGFLGANGSGKSTTMRMMLGLDKPDAGQVRIGGQRFHDLRWPLREVGALLEARAFHPGRSARSHLAALAASNAIPPRRVDEVLDLVGLTSVAGKRAGKFSLGMGQRLGIAAALLGDPAVLLLDEPVNGLDPAGIHWIRELLTSLAAQGRVVFVSSHLISEMALMAERLIVIGQGRLLADTSVAEMSAGAPSLEAAFLAMTEASTEYRAAGAAPGSLQMPLGRLRQHERTAHDDRARSTRPGRALPVPARRADGVDQDTQPALDLVDSGDHGGRHHRDRRRGRDEHDERYRGRD